MVEIHRLERTHEKPTTSRTRREGGRKEKKKIEAKESSGESRPNANTFTAQRGWRRGGLDRSETARVPNVYPNPCHREKGSQVLQRYSSEKLRTYLQISMRIDQNREPRYFLSPQKPITSSWKWIYSQKIQSQIAPRTECDFSPIFHGKMTFFFMCRFRMAIFASTWISDSRIIVLTDVSSFFHRNARDNYFDPFFFAFLFNAAEDTNSARLRLCFRVKSMSIDEPGDGSHWSIAAGHRPWLIRPLDSLLYGSRAQKRIKRRDPCTLLWNIYV